MTMYPIQAVMPELMEEVRCWVPVIIFSSLYMQSRLQCPERGEAVSN